VVSLKHNDKMKNLRFKKIIFPFICLFIIAMSTKGNQAIPHEKLYLSMDKSSYLPGDTLWFRGFLINASSDSYLVKSNFVYVELYNKRDSLVARKKIKRIDFSFDNNFILPVSLPNGDYYIRAYTLWMRNFSRDYFFMHNIRIDNSGMKATQNNGLPAKIEFFPEGGVLLSGIKQKVAFKATHADGTPAPFDGYLCNQKGEHLSQMATTHDGFGVFEITANPGDLMYAISSDMPTLKFKMPAVAGQGLSLAVDASKDILSYQVLGQNSLGTLMLLAESHGRILQQRILNKMQDTLSIKNYPDGILQLKLCSSDGKVLSKRLVFVDNHFGEQKWTVTTDQSSYDNGANVKLSIALKDNSNSPMNGDFSVCVTDNAQYTVDNERDNIVSNLLLTSELKQSVWHAGWYFGANDAQHRQALDLLMMTSSNDYYNTDSISFNYPIEVGQSLTGSVKGLPKDEHGDKISAMSVNDNTFGDSKLKDDGSFEINNLQYPDSTVFAIKVLSERKRGLDITTNDNDFPDIYNKNPFSNYIMSSMTKDEAESLRLRKGIKVINLGDVEVKGNRSKSKYFSSSYVFASFDKTKLNKNFDFNIIKSGLSLVNDIILYQFPFKFLPRASDNPEDALLGPENPNYGTSENSTIATRDKGDNNSSYYGRLFTAVVNDQIYKGEESVVGVLERIDARDITNIEFISREYNMENEGSAAVVITLRPDAQLLPEIPDSRMVYSYPLGYAWPVWFRDISSDRTTIYWNPTVQLGKAGETTIQFPATQHPQKYHITIEGVSFNGKICRYSEDIIK